MRHFLNYRRSNRILAVRLIASLLPAMLLIFYGGTLLAQDVTPTSVTITWTSPGDDGVIGTASEYDVRYSLSLITEANWADAIQVSGEPSPQPSGSQETFTINGLQPSTTYYIAVKSADEVPNWSDLSNVISRTTLEEATPPAVIANLTLNNPTLNSITLHWTAPGDDGTSGTAAEYDIRYSTAPINDGNWDAAAQVDNEPAPKPAGFAESFIVDGLSPSTTYYFAVKTADEVPNWSGLSNVPNLATATEETPPAAIAGMTADNITGNSVRLNWIAPGDDGNVGTASQYDIRYSTSPINGSNWDDAVQLTGEPAPSAAGSSQSFTVTGLDMETTYYFAIKTADEVPNWSDLSNVVSATTVDDVPPAAVNDLAGVVKLILLDNLV